MSEIALLDILSELEKVGFDPRDVGNVKLRTGALGIDDLKLDEWLEGTVTNVLDFGCFIDIGIGKDGMMHKSQINYNNYNRCIYDSVSVGEVLRVRIDNIDKERQRVGLSMKPHSARGDEKERKEEKNYKRKRDETSHEKHKKVKK